MYKEQSLKNRSRFFQIAYVVFVLAFNGVLFFMRDHGFAWEATLFGQALLVILSTIWPLYSYARTKDKEYLLLLLFGLAAWGLPLLSQITKAP